MSVAIAFERVGEAGRQPTTWPSEDPLRVMFVTTGMTVGGHEQITLKLALGMDRSRFRPVVCCLKELGDLGQRLLDEGVPVYAELMAHKFDVRVLVRLARLMRRHRVDLVCTVGTGGDRMFWGRLAARLAGVPRVVSSLHSMGEPDRVEWPNRLLHPGTHAFLTVAHAQKRYMVEREGIPSDRTHVIHNGVDVEAWVRTDPDPALAHSLGIEPHCPMAGIVACLRPEKNHEVFLHMARRVLDVLPYAHFLIVGDGPKRGDLTLLAGQLGLADRAHFVGQRHDVPDLVALMDVMVLSSRAEAFPMTILEGMAAGKPIVATDVGAVSEVVRHGQNGYLVPAGDVEAMAGYVGRLLADRGLGARLGRAGRDLVSRRFHLRNMIQGYERLFMSLVNGPMAPRGPVGSPTRREDRL